MSAADCDCCAERPGIRTVWVYGLETWACHVCLGDDPPEEQPAEAHTGEQTS